MTDIQPNRKAAHEWAKRACGPNWRAYSPASRNAAAVILALHDYPRVRSDAYAKGLADALGIIASLGYGANEDVDRGHEESYRAIQEHASKWQNARADLEALEKTDE